MSSQPPSDKLSKEPTSHSLPTFHTSGFVNRYKLQRQRIQTLNQLEKSEAKKKAHRSLPKIHGGADKENLVIRAVRRSNTMDVKLPGVKTANAPQPPPAPPPSKKKTLPVKTYHLRVNPEHTSFISKSLPSLPSIPGSPSYPEDQAVSPLTERITDRDKAKVPIYTSKHRFEKIVFQKHIHRDATDISTSNEKKGDSHLGSHRLPAFKTVPSMDRTHHPLLPSGPHESRTQDKPHTSGSIRLRYSKVPSEVVISETQSEPSFEVTRKWKENCRCLRCQMLKRQFREGDSHYSLWGNYPCHQIDPSIVLDD